MKIKHLLPYILVFLASCILTPIVFTSIIKNANKNAQEYIDHFNPLTHKLPNGKYLGKYKTLKILTLAKIEFEIKNGQVTHVQLKRLFHSPSSPYKEEIEFQIIQTKKLEVNTISGATRTSNFAKAAIKDALKNVCVK